MKNITNGLKINQLLRLVVLVGVCFSVNVSPMMSALSERWTGQLQREEAVNKKRGLLIFLDEQEKDDFGATSYNLLTALYQEAGPILVSTSLLCTLRDHRQKDDRPIDSLLIEFQYKKLDVKEKDVLLSRLCFKEERWIIKKINNSLNLLIPQSHLKSFNIDESKVKEFSNVINIISDVELLLGLKVNHMETIDLKSISMSLYTNLANYFVDSLDAIFCKKSDYKDRKLNAPEWCIYIDGHGLVNYAIAYLTLNDFKKFLNFLETNVIVQLLVVVSCYVAGVNVDKIYGELKLGTQQYYSFPIIIQGINDVSTVTTPPWISFTLELRSMKSFIDFLEKAKKVEGNYDEIIKPIITTDISNTPQIKLPGIEWFSVIEVKNKVVSIGSVLAQTRDPQKSLDIVSFFKKYPDLILLYTDNIPFELVLPPKSFEGIGSMVSSGPLVDTPEFVIHRIKKISWEWGDFSGIARQFMVGGSKWFFIDEIDGNKDILIFAASNEQTVAGRTNATCYFKDQNNILFKAELWKYETVEANLEDKKDYEAKMSVVRKYLELSEKKQMITSEQIKKIENVLTEQPAEKQKKLIKAYTVSEPEVD